MFVNKPQSLGYANAMIPLQTNSEGLEYVIEVESVEEGLAFVIASHKPGI